MDIWESIEFGAHAVRLKLAASKSPQEIQRLGRSRLAQLVHYARAKSEYWREKLEQFCAKYAFIDSPRGIGLMRAVNVKHDLASTIVQQALEHGLLLNSTSPATLRMVPPLILTKGDLDEAAELLDRTLADVAAMPIANA